MQKQIICIKWGTKYGAEYVNRLYGMVTRNITPPFRFVCFTDSCDGLIEGIETHPLPPLDFELPVTRKGIWPKCRLWNKQLADLQGPVLFLDLDLVITGNLDPFFTYGAPDDVVLAYNPSNPLERLGQTSVYRFPVGKLYPLLEAFKANPSGIAETYKYEQRFVTRHTPGGVKFWPRRSVRHFRRDCMLSVPFNYFRPPRLPAQAQIVIFPGHLTPLQAIRGCYQKETDAQRSPLQHLADSFNARRRENIFKHLRHYLLPTPWVAEHWRE